MYMKVTAKSMELQRAVDFHVILPFHDGFEDAARPYPTLYFLPGYSGNAEELMFALPLRQMALKYGIAIVVPDGENAFYTDHPERANNLGRFVSRELVGITRRMFPVLSDRREDTFLGGISMGGYGALVLGLHERETFSKIALFSPAADPGMLLNAGNEDVEGSVPHSLFDSLLGGHAAYDESARLNPLIAIEKYQREGIPLPPIWMSCGREDALVGDACQQVRDALREAGANLEWEDGPGGHDLMYWDDHLDSAFQFLHRE